MAIKITIRDKETKLESEEVDIEDIILNQREIEFKFPEGEDGIVGTLPYSDFLFFVDDYDVIIKVVEDE